MERVRNLHVSDDALVGLCYFPPLNSVVTTDSVGQLSVYELGGMCLRKASIPTTSPTNLNHELNISYFEGCQTLIITCGRLFNSRSSYCDCLLLDSILSSPFVQPSESVVVDLNYYDAKSLKYLLCFDSGHRLYLENNGVTVIDTPNCGDIPPQWLHSSLIGPKRTLICWANLVIESLQENNKELIDIAYFIRTRVINMCIHEDNLLSLITYRNPGVMHDEGNRRLTFANWPHVDYQLASPETMAKAGFYLKCIGTDSSVCFACDTHLGKWESTDVPLSEHARHSPGCSFVSNKYPYHLPLSRRRSTEPPRLQSSSPLPITVLGTSTSNEFVVTSTLHGDIVIWDVSVFNRKAMVFQLRDLLKSACGNTAIPHDHVEVYSACLLLPESPRRLASPFEQDFKSTALSDLPREHYLILGCRLPSWLLCLLTEVNEHGDTEQQAVCQLHACILVLRVYPYNAMQTIWAQGALPEDPPSHRERLYFGNTKSQAEQLVRLTGKMVDDSNASNFEAVTAALLMEPTSMTVAGTSSDLPLDSTDPLKTLPDKLSSDNGSMPPAVPDQLPNADDSEDSSYSFFDALGLSEIAAVSAMLLGKDADITSHRDAPAAASDSQPVSSPQTPCRVEDSAAYCKPAAHQVFTTDQSSIEVSTFDELGRLAQQPQFVELVTLAPHWVDGAVKGACPLQLLPVQPLPTGHSCTSSSTFSKGILVSCGLPKESDAAQAETQLGGLLLFGYDDKKRDSILSDAPLSCLQLPRAKCPWKTIVIEPCPHELSEGEQEASTVPPGLPRGDPVRGCLECLFITRDGSLFQTHLPVDSASQPSVKCLLPASDTSSKFTCLTYSSAVGIVYLGDSSGHLTLMQKASVVEASLDASGSCVASDRNLLSHYDKLFSQLLGVPGHMGEAMTQLHQGIQSTPLQNRFFVSPNLPSGWVEVMLDRKGDLCTVRDSSGDDVTNLLVHHVTGLLTSDGYTLISRSQLSSANHPTKPIDLTVLPIHLSYTCATSARAWEYNPRKVALMRGTTVPSQPEELIRPSGSPNDFMDYSVDITLMRPERLSHFGLYLKLADMDFRRLPPVYISLTMGLKTMSSHKEDATETEGHFERLPETNEHILDDLRTLFADEESPVHKTMDAIDQSDAYRRRVPCLTRLQSTPGRCWRFPHGHPLPTRRLHDLGGLRILAGPYLLSDFISDEQKSNDPVVYVPLTDLELLKCHRRVFAVHFSILRTRNTLESDWPLPSTLSDIFTQIGVTVHTAGRIPQTLASPLSNVQLLAQRNRLIALRSRNCHSELFSWLSSSTSYYPRLQRTALQLLDWIVTMFHHEIDEQGFRTLVPGLLALAASHCDAMVTHLLVRGDRQLVQLTATLLFNLISLESLCLATSSTSQSAVLTNSLMDLLCSSLDNKEDRLTHLLVNCRCSAAMDVIFSLLAALVDQMTEQDRTHTMEALLRLMVQISQEKYAPDKNTEVTFNQTATSRLTSYCGRSCLDLDSTQLFDLRTGYWSPLGRGCLTLGNGKALTSPPPARKLETEASLTASADSDIAPGSSSDQQQQVLTNLFETLFQPDYPASDETEVVEISSGEELASEPDTDYKSGFEFIRENVLSLPQAYSMFLDHVSSAQGEPNQPLTYAQAATAGLMPSGTDETDRMSGTTKKTGGCPLFLQTDKLRSAAMEAQVSDLLALMQLRHGVRVSSASVNDSGAFILPDLQDWQFRGLLEVEPLRVNVGGSQASPGCSIEPVNLFTGLPSGVDSSSGDQFAPARGFSVDDTDLRYLAVTEHLEHQAEAYHLVIKDLHPNTYRSATLAFHPPGLAAADEPVHQLTDLIIPVNPCLACLTVEALLDASVATSLDLPSARLVTYSQRIGEFGLVLRDICPPIPFSHLRVTVCALPTINLPRTRIHLGAYFGRSGVLSLLTTTPQVTSALQWELAWAGCQPLHQLSSLPLESDRLLHCLHDTIAKSLTLIHSTRLELMQALADKRSAVEHSSESDRSTLVRNLYRQFCSERYHLNWLHACLQRIVSHTPSFCEQEMKNEAHQTLPTLVSAMLQDKAGHLLEGLLTFFVGNSELFSHVQLPTAVLSESAIPALLQLTLATSCPTIQVLSIGLFPHLLQPVYSGLVNLDPGVSPTVSVLHQLVDRVNSGMWTHLAPAEASRCLVSSWALIHQLVNSLSGRLAVGLISDCLHLLERTDLGSSRQYHLLDILDLLLERGRQSSRFGTGNAPTSSLKLLNQCLEASRCASQFGRIGEKGIAAWRYRRRHPGASTDGLAPRGSGGGKSREGWSSLRRRDQNGVPVDALAHYDCARAVFYHWHTQRLLRCLKHFTDGRVERYKRIVADAFPLGALFTELQSDFCLMSSMQKSIPSPLCSTLDNLCNGSMNLGMTENFAGKSLRWLITESFSGVPSSQSSVPAQDPSPLLHDPVVQAGLTRLMHMAFNYLPEKISNCMSGSSSTQPRNSEKSLVQEYILVCRIIGRLLGSLRLDCLRELLQTNGDLERLLLKLCSPDKSWTSSFFEVVACGLVLIFTQDPCVSANERLKKTDVGAASGKRSKPKRPGKRRRILPDPVDTMHIIPNYVKPSRSLNLSQLLRDQVVLAEQRLLVVTPPVEQSPGELRQQGRGEEAMSLSTAVLSPRFKALLDKALSQHQSPTASAAKAVDLTKVLLLYLELVGEATFQPCKFTSGSSTVCQTGNHSQVSVPVANSQLVDLLVVMEEAGATSALVESLPPLALRFITSAVTNCSNNEEHRQVLSNPNFRSFMVGMLQTNLSYGTDVAEALQTFLTCSAFLPMPLPCSEGSSDTNTGLSCPHVLDDFLVHCITKWLASPVNQTSSGSSPANTPAFTTNLHTVILSAFFSRVQPTKHGLPSVLDDPVICSPHTIEHKPWPVRAELALTILDHLHRTMASLQQPRPPPTGQPSADDDDDVDIDDDSWRLLLTNQMTIFDSTYRCLQNAVCLWSTNAIDKAIDEMNSQGTDVGPGREDPLDVFNAHEGGIERLVCCIHTSRPRSISRETLRNWTLPQLGNIFNVLITGLASNYDCLGDCTTESCVTKVLHCTDTLVNLLQVTRVPEALQSFVSVASLIGGWSSLKRLVNQLIAGSHPSTCVDWLLKSIYHLVTHWPAAKERCRNVCLKQVSTSSCALAVVFLLSLCDVQTAAEEGELTSRLLDLTTNHEGFLEEYETLRILPSVECALHSKFSSNLLGVGLGEVSELGRSLTLTPMGNCSLEPPRSGLVSDCMPAGLNAPLSVFSSCADQHWHRFSRSSLPDSSSATCSTATLSCVDGPSARLVDFSSVAQLVAPANETEIYSANLATLSAGHSEKAFPLVLGFLPPSGGADSVGGSPSDYLLLSTMDASTKGAHTGLIPLPLNRSGGCRYALVTVRFPCTIWMHRIEFYTSDVPKPGLSHMVVDCYRDLSAGPVHHYSLGSHDSRVGQPAGSRVQTTSTDDNPRISLNTPDCLVNRLLVRIYLPASGSSAKPIAGRLAFFGRHMDSTLLAPAIQSNRECSPTTLSLLCSLHNQLFKCPLALPVVTGRHRQLVGCLVNCLVVAGLNKTVASGIRQLVSLATSHDDLRQAMDHFRSTAPLVDEFSRSNTGTVIEKRKVNMLVTTAVLAEKIILYLAIHQVPGGAPRWLIHSGLADVIISRVLMPMEEVNEDRQEVVSPNDEPFEYIDFGSPEADLTSQIQIDRLPWDPMSLVGAKPCQRLLVHLCSPTTSSESGTPSIAEQRVRQLVAWLHRLCDLTNQRREQRIPMRYAADLVVSISSVLWRYRGLAKTAPQDTWSSLIDDTIVRLVYQSILLLKGQSAVFRKHSQSPPDGHDDLAEALVSLCCSLLAIRPPGLSFLLSDILTPSAEHGQVDFFAQLNVVGAVVRSEPVVDWLLPSTSHPPQTGGPLTEVCMWLKDWLSSAQSLLHPVDAGQMAAAFRRLHLLAHLLKPDQPNRLRLQLGDLVCQHVLPSLFSHFTALQPRHQFHLRNISSLLRGNDVVLSRLFPIVVELCHALMSPLCKDENQEEQFPLDTNQKSLVGLMLRSISESTNDGVLEIPHLTRSLLLDTLKSQTHTHSVAVFCVPPTATAFYSFSGPPIAPTTPLAEDGDLEETLCTWIRRAAQNYEISYSAHPALSNALLLLRLTSQDSAAGTSRDQAIEGAIRWPPSNPLCVRHIRVMVYALLYPLVSRATSLLRQGASGPAGLEFAILPSNPHCFSPAFRTSAESWKHAVPLPADSSDQWTLDRLSHLGRGHAACAAIGYPPLCILVRCRPDRVTSPPPADSLGSSLLHLSSYEFSFTNALVDCGALQFLNKCLVGSGDELDHIHGLTACEKAVDPSSWLTSSPEDQPKCDTLEDSWSISHFYPTCDLAIGNNLFGLAPSTAPAPLHCLLTYIIFVPIPGFVESMVSVIDSMSGNETVTDKCPTPTTSILPELMQCIPSLIKSGSPTNNGHPQIPPTNSSSSLNTCRPLPFEALYQLYQHISTDPDQSAHWSGVGPRHLSCGALSLLLKFLSSLAHLPTAPTHDSDSPSRSLVPDLSPALQQLINAAQADFNRELDSLTGGLGKAGKRPVAASNCRSKGTGFSTGSCFSAWDPSAVNTKLAREDCYTTMIINLLSGFLRLFAVGFQGPMVKAISASLLAQSDWLQLVMNHLRNDSPLDLSTRVPLYRAIFYLLRTVAQCPQLHWILVSSSEDISSGSTAFLTSTVAASEASDRWIGDRNAVRSFTASPTGGAGVNKLPLSSPASLFMCMKGNLIKYETHLRKFGVSVTESELESGKVKDLRRLALRRAGLFRQNSIRYKSPRDYLCRTRRIGVFSPPASVPPIADESQSSKPRSADGEVLTQSMHGRPGIDVVDGKESSNTPGGSTSRSRHDKALDCLKPTGPVFGLLRPFGYSTAEWSNLKEGVSKDSESSMATRCDRSGSQVGDRREEATRFSRDCADADDNVEERVPGSDEGIDDQGIEPCAKETPSSLDIPFADEFVEATSAPLPKVSRLPADGDGGELHQLVAEAEYTWTLLRGAVDCYYSVQDWSLVGQTSRNSPQREGGVDASITSPSEGAAGASSKNANSMYCQRMQPLQFNTVEMMSSSTVPGHAVVVIPHTFVDLVARLDNLTLASALPAGDGDGDALLEAVGVPSTSSVIVAQETSATASNSTHRTCRLAQEVFTLANGLPLAEDSSIFVLADDSRLFMLKALITGPVGTPYAHGSFIFDIYIPVRYPNAPPIIRLVTTGNGTVRFNPNLYENGNVCLSIINTWQGRPEERWNPKSSSLLQVLVSIQSLIFVAEPFFNEPGYESYWGTHAGTKQSITYNATIRAATIHWAILHQLQHPPPGFEQVVLNHFYLKRFAIVEQVERWIDDMSEDSSADVQKWVEMMKADLITLRKEFAVLETRFASTADL